MYALVEFKGKQYKVEKDAMIRVDALDNESESTIDVDTVLMINDDGNVQIGTPYVSGASVRFRVKDSFRDKKVLVFKHESKKDYHRLHGHRQHYTNVLAEEIVTK